MALRERLIRMLKNNFKDTARLENKCRYVINRWIFRREKASNLASLAAVAEGNYNCIRLFNCGPAQSKKAQGVEWTEATAVQRHSIDDGPCIEYTRPKEVKTSFFCLENTYIITLIWHWRFGWTDSPVMPPQKRTNRSQNCYMSSERQPGSAQQLNTRTDFCPILWITSTLPYRGTRARGQNCMT
jgi:hypothetical protein